MVRNREFNQLWNLQDQNNKINNVGEYNRYGKKKGRWDIMYCKDGDEEYIQNGGGSYNNEQDRITRKIGDWIELVDESRWIGQIINLGQYNEVGIKAGIWVKMDLDKNKKLDEIKYIN
ncbi:unnamed protein product [Paramecium sonneborni]|uniref:Uncharacterized protein n=1 Tax=Paramecium sonneborni TaxID=65129 RepID=A0A8S1Q9Y9_9CILI|nr:unnamed protein product [Paramecium sonneborni]